MYHYGSVFVIAGSVVVSFLFMVDSYTHIAGSLRAAANGTIQIELISNMIRV